MKTQSAFIFGSAWLLTVAASFYTGLRISAESAANRKTYAAARQVELGARPVALQASSDGDTLTEQTEPSDDQSATTNSSDTAEEGGTDTLSRRINLILTEKDFLTRSSKLAELLSRLGPESLVEAKAYFAELANNGWENNREIEMFLHAWARFDPKAAMDFARENISGRGGMFMAASVLREWAIRDKVSALDWILAQQDGRTRQISLAILLNSESARDPEVAIQTLKMLPEGQADERVVGMVAERLATTNPSLALDWAATLTNPAMRNSAMRNIAEGWAQKDPASAGEWLRANISADFAPQAAREIASAMAQNNPQEALAWLSSLPAGESANAAAAALAGEWAQSDAAAAGAWLNSLPQGDLADAAVERYARTVARTDPASSVEWALSIEDATARRKAFIDLAGYWKREDPEVANAYLSRLGLDETTLAEIERASSSRRPPWGGRDR